MKYTSLIVFFFLHQLTFAQNNRQSDYNNINWIQVFITKKINIKTDWLVEYQLRRVSGFKHGQQGLLRSMLQYKPNEQLALGFGYAEVETFPYGDFPIASAGRFPEHRIFEQVIVKQKINKVFITNRFRIEQRWVGKIKLNTSREIEEWVYFNRFRYLLKIQMPLHKNIYGWVGDELFIGAGKNVGINIFDQNRLHLNIGYKFNNKISMEIGYLNQILQQGRLINAKAIMQRNNGLVLSTSINF
jgi:hypothetical protein